MARNKINPFARLNDKITKNIPELSFVGKYRLNDNEFNSNMMAYKYRAFIYVLTIFEKDEINVIYVGKSKSQYARMINHAKKYEFDHVYLYTCKSDLLNICERQAIKLLTPLYNKNLNPFYDNFKKLGIDYDAPQQNRQTTLIYLERKKFCNASGLYGYTLPIYINDLICVKAKEKCCPESEFLQWLIENYCGEDFIKEAIENADINKRYTPNFLCTSDFAELHSKRVEWIKKICREGRIRGALKFKRDWLIPQDAILPDDHRKKFRENE